jgi:putative phosphoribosyl transferase
VSLTTTTFVDRADAGRRLAVPLEAWRSPHLVVMGMARGGVPVAHRGARILGAPLDVLVVRKLGYPSQPELGLGALGEGGVQVVNAPLVARLGVSAEVMADVVRRETIELERRLRVYRGNRPPLDLAGRTVIVVDDGLATGFTARAAVEVVRRAGAACVVVAVPVGAPDAVSSLAAVADEVVCLESAGRFLGISQCYADFDQVSDSEVTRLLADPVIGATP